jgi:cyclic pyranopterin monophosphate synthase
MSRRITHQDESGRPTMVDVGAKADAERAATAEGALVMEPATLDALRRGRTPKGDPLLVAQIAGIQAAKRTAELIPLCHSLPLSTVDVRLELDDALPGIRATATARVTAKTGVEMEALTAVAVALLTAYDMLKGIDRGMRLADIRLLAKSGGRSGAWTAMPRERPPGTAPDHDVAPADAPAAE